MIDELKTYKEALAKALEENHTLKLKKDGDSSQMKDDALCSRCSNSENIPIVEPCQSPEDMSTEEFTFPEFVRLKRENRQLKIQVHNFLTDYIIVTFCSC